MKSWKAENFGEIDDVLKCLEVPELGPPPAGCVTVKVLTAGVGLPDALMTQGNYPFVPAPPVSPGSGSDRSEAGFGVIDSKEHS